MKKRLLSMILSLTMVLSLLPAVHLTASAAGDAPQQLFVNGVDMIANPGTPSETYYYTAATGTLTLNNASITTPYVKGSESYGIYANNGHLTIEVQGRSTISLLKATQNDYHYGIYALDLTLTGSGLLDIDSSDAKQQSYGIKTAKELKIDGCGMNITVGDAEQESYGIYATNAALDIRNKSGIVANSGKAQMSVGVYVNEIAVDQAELTATADDSSGKAGQRSMSYGVAAEKVALSTGAELTGTSGAAKETYGVSIRGGANGSTSTVTGSAKLIGKGGTSDDTSAGVYFDRNLLVELFSVVNGTAGATTNTTNYGVYCGGTLTAQSGSQVEGTGASGRFSCGILADSGLSIENAYVKGTAQNATGSSIGVSTGDFESITVDGDPRDTKLEGTSGTVTESPLESQGIRGGSITVLGGAVTGTGAKVGVYTYTELKMSGGTLTAKGDEKAYETIEGPVTLTDGVALTAPKGAGLAKMSSGYIYTTDGTSEGTPVKQLTMGPTAPTITTDSELPSVLLGAKYSQKLAATGSKEITWTLATGSSLPAGIELFPSGILDGTPTQAGTFTFTIEASNTLGKDSKTFTLKIGHTYQAKVRIQGEHMGLDGVTATLKQNGIEVDKATSKNVGYISFGGLSSGTYTLELSSAGYFTSTETITIPTTGLTPVFYIKPDLQIPSNPVVGDTELIINGRAHKYQEMPNDDYLSVEVGVPHADWYSMGDGYLSTYSPDPADNTGTISVCFADYTFSHNKNAALMTSGSLNLQIKGESKIKSSTANTLIAGSVKLTGSGTLTLEGGIGISAASIVFNDFYGALNGLIQLSSGTEAPSIYNSTGAVLYNSKTPLSVTDQDRLVIFPGSTLTIAPGSTLDLSAIPASNWAKRLWFLDQGISPGTIVNNGTIKIAGTKEAFLAAYAGKISGSGTIETTTLPSYDVTVIGGTSSPSKAAKGETVTITATAPAGQQFKEWKLEPSTVSFTDDTRNDFERARFTMPDEAVKATAVFEPIQVSIISVRVSPKPIQVQQGTTQAFFATVRGTSTFDNTVTWTVTDGNAGTSISDTGVLTVAPDESATSLTVTATANGDPLKYDTASVTVATTPVTKYTVTVNNGTGSATYEPNSQVIITATVPAGQKFKTWTVSGGAVWLVDAESVSTRFTMPPEDVIVTASFEDTSHIHSYTGTWQYDSSQHWQLCSCGDKGNIASHSGNPCTVCNYSYSSGGDSGSAGSGGSGGSSGGGGGGGGTSTPPKTGTVTNADGSTTKTETTSKTDSSTGAKVESKTEITTAKDGSVTKTETSTISGGKDGLSGTIIAITNAAGEVSITITLTTKEGSSQVQLPADVVEAAKRGENITTRLTVGGLSMTFDAKSLKAILSVGGSAPLVSVTPVVADKLPESIRSAATAFDFQVGGKGADFDGGSVSVSVRYTPKDSSKSIGVYYVKPDGSLQRVSGASFENGIVTFTQSHWSIYAIVEETPLSFTDVAQSAWYYDAVRWAAEQKLLNGTSSTAFSPNDSMTRGMFMTALGRLAGIDSRNYTNSKFSDVPAMAYYSPYVAWAAEKGITSGTTTTTFAPDQAITRQEMAVIMQNYAKTMNYSIPKTREATNFADSVKIAAWAKDAVSAMQMASIMHGKDGNRFDPSSTASRAEVTAVLQRYVELIVDVNNSNSATEREQLN